MKFAHFSHVWSKPGMTIPERYDQLWRELALADELGFEFGFTVEHHFNPEESLMPCPSLYCAGAAAHTQQMRLGPMGYIPALYDPIRLVEEVAVLDNVLNGRLEIGLVSGVVPDFFRHIGRADFADRTGLTEETISLFKTAFGTDGPFTFEGPFHKYENVSLSVKPLQKPYPPIWRQTRDPERLRVLAQEGIHTGYIFLYPRASVASRYREYLRIWSEVGHPNKPNIGYWTLVYVDESDDKAVSTVASHIVHAMSVTFGGVDKVDPSESGFAKAARQSGDLGLIEMAQHLTDVDYLMENNLVFVGSPETVTRQIREAASEGLFNTLMAEFNLGTLPEADLMRSIQLFGTQVMPYLKDYSPY